MMAVIDNAGSTFSFPFDSTTNDEPYDEDVEPLDYFDHLMFNVYMPSLQLPSNPEKEDDYQPIPLSLPQNKQMVTKKMIQKCGRRTDDKVQPATTEMSPENTTATRRREAPVESSVTAVIVDKANNTSISMNHGCDDSASQQQEIVVTAIPVSDEDSIASIPSKTQSTIPGPGTAPDSVIQGRADQLSEEDRQVTTTISSIERFDIVCGRESLVHTHPGNKRFRELIERYRSEYQSATSRDTKTRTKYRIYEEVRTWSPGGRFVKKLDSNNNNDNSRKAGPVVSSEWVEASEDFALEKVSHALRNTKVPKRRKRARTETPPQRIQSSCDNKAVSVDGTAQTEAGFEEVPVDIGAFRTLYTSNLTFRALYDNQQQIFFDLVRHETEETDSQDDHPDDLEADQVPVAPANSCESKAKVDETYPPTHSRSSRKRRTDEQSCIGTRTRRRQRH